MATKTPLALVKETFGDKSKLVEAVEKLTSEDLWVARTNENKGLAHVSNAKLLRLHATFAQVKKEFGTRDKLIDAILDLQKRSKDTSLRQKLAAWPVPRLYDTYRSTAKRLGATAEKAPQQARPKGDAARTPKATAVKKAPKKAATQSAAKGAKKTVKRSTGAKKSGRG
jgi:hypothetical protein